jgi:hypothetical protein
VVCVLTDGAPPDLNNLLGNPQVMNAAQQMMSSPQFSQILNNPLFMNMYVMSTMHSFFFFFSSSGQSSSSLRARVACGVLQGAEPDAESVAAQPDVLPDGRPSRRPAGRR